MAHARPGGRLIAIVGATASGKSAVALEVARQMGHAELVSVDAFQVYRHMDIGTAKPSAAERHEIPHHLLDLVNPDQEFTVADFREQYEVLRDDLAARGCTGLLVGGTGLYQRMVVDEFTLPGQWPELRAQLELEAETAGTSSLHQRLVALDPQAAERMEPTNTRRVVRALEVCLGSGRRFSSFGPGLQAYPATPVMQIGLRWQRDRLGERIQHRVDQMILSGFEDEVRRLGQTWSVSRTAGQALGYGEMAEVVAGRCSLAAAAEAITLRTRQLAVRQERWFRRDPRIRWIDISSDPVAEAVPAVLEAFND